MGTRKSTTDNQHQFAQVPSVSVPRSSFNRSCGHKTTFDAGFLIPVFHDEVLPGDTLSLKMTHFARLATPIHPVMDNMFLDSFFFFVPNRLLWTNWERFNGAQDNPGDSTDYMIPYVTAPTGITNGDLGDYFGIPTETTFIAFNALYFRAYALIWDQWFRDENLQDSIAAPKDDGPDPIATYELKRRGKRFDYFTSALPAPQKGDAVTIGIGGTAPLSGIVGVDTDGTQPLTDWATGTDSVLTAVGTVVNVPVGGTNNQWTAFGTNTGLQADLTGGTADLSAATSVTINALRQAFQIQELLERDARGGTRYTETLRSHFGVTSPDARLMRSEFLGGGTNLIRLSAVAQTSETDTTAQGNLAAFGVSVDTSGSGFTQSFTEHGVIIGLVSVRADLNYQQGLHRNFTRLNRFDYYWPSFSRLGEQTILNQEILYAGDSGDYDVFGYQERYAEYRYKPSMITGKMRSNTPGGSLDTWHLAQDFDSLPVLDSEFIEEDPPIDRIIAVDTEPHFLFDGMFTYKSVRPMPVYGIPGLGSRF